MPSRLRNVDAIPIDTIPLDGGDYVKMRRWLTAVDRDAINDKTVNLDAIQPMIQRGGKMMNLRGAVDISAVNRLTVLQALTEWGGVGFCETEHEDAEGNALEIPEGHVCKSVPITLENLSMLPDQDLQLLVNRLNAGRPLPLVKNGSTT
jgi:hypothetical protein